MGRGRTSRHLKIKTSRLFISIFRLLRKRASNKLAHSAGEEKQMLAISRMLMCELKLLLLDEPSAGLAPLLVKYLFEILKGCGGIFH